MVLYSYSLQIIVVRKIFTTYKLHTVNICCLVLSLIFFLSTSILLEQTSLLATHIKHRRTENRAYHKDGESSLSQAKNSLILLKIRCISYFLFLSFSLFICNHFHTDGLHLCSVEPCSSILSLSHSAFILDAQSSTDKMLATTYDRQILQNSGEKQYCHSYIA